MISTAAFHARVRGSVPGLGGWKKQTMFLPHPRVKVSIAGSLRDREVASSASDRQGSNFESCVWRTVSSQSSHHPQEVLLAQFSLYVHKGGLKPDSFHFISFHTRSEHVIKYKWKSDSAASFQSNVSDECIELILHTMDRAEAEGNKVSDDICKVLKQFATASGLSHEVKVSAKKPRRRALPHKPWYNTECEEARRNMLKYRNKYRRLKNATHFNEVRVYSKQYKKTVNKAFREYKKPP